MENTENTNIEEIVETNEENNEQEQQDVQQLINDVKQQYEQKLVQVKTKYETRIQERDNVIKQLLAGEQKEEEKGIIEQRIEALNAKRALQNKKW